MSVIAYPIKKPHGIRAPIAVQLVFQPTRTRLIPLQLVTTEKLDDPGVFEGGGPVITYRTPQLKEIDFDNASILVAYKGEPPRYLGDHWPSERRDLLESAQFIDLWLQCRRHASCGNPAREFFLDFDKWSFVDPVYNPKLAQFPLSVINDVQGMLYHNRIEHRSHNWAVGNLSNRPELEAIAEGWASLLQGPYFGSLDDERKACEAFAAGHLKHECPPPSEGLRTLMAGDADSANIFLFAEFSLAMVELSNEGKCGSESSETGEFWRSRVNMFARMQALFMERWKPFERRSFERYDGSAPPLDCIPTVLLKEYDDAGDDLDALESLIKKQLCRMVWPQ